MVRAAGRVIGRRTVSNRYVRAGFSAADATVRGAARATRILWLQVTGFFCAIFALSISGAVWREWHRANVAHREWKLAIGSLVLALFAWFAVSNFWRARRLDRRER